MIVPNAINKTLWIAPPVAQAFITGIILTRRLYRDFPWFFIYTVSHIVRFCILWNLVDNPAVYFWSYWAAEALDAALGLGVIAEVYRTVLRDFDAIQKLGTFLFRFAFIILVCLAAVSALSPMNEYLRVSAVVLTFARGVGIVQCGLLLLLFGFASFLAFSWKRYSYGIALGIAVSSGMGLAVDAFTAYAGPQANSAFVLLRPMIYSCAVLVWLVYFLRPSVSIAEVRHLPNANLVEWNASLAGFLSK